ncbi:MAG: LytTR family DNA-binding domain-containing protein [Sediminicola sp.]
MKTHKNRPSSNTPTTLWQKGKLFLGRPYPFYYGGRSAYALVPLVFLMSLFFNYWFEPFEVYVPEHRMPFFLICVVHAFVSILVLVPQLLFVSRFSHPHEKWTVGRELLFLGGYLLAVGISQFLIRDIIYDNPHNWSWRYFYEEIRNTFLVGSLFVSVLVPLNFNRLQRKSAERAKKLIVSPITADMADSPATVFIITELKGDDFLLQPSRLLYAKAERNYVEFFLKGETVVEKVLKRISIKSLEAQLHCFPIIVKTHRSYLVNLAFVQKVGGNAQGYKISLTESGHAVPVSRKFIPKFEEKMNPPSNLG